MHVFERLLSAIAPHRCISCGVEGTPLCPPCCQGLPVAPKCCYKCGKPAQNGVCGPCGQQSYLRSITIRTVYEGVSEQAVHQLKFDRNRAMADALVRSMATRCPAGVIVPVPTANSRARQRGYDQADLMARALAMATGHPRQQLLQRVGKQRQLGQGRIVRLNQLRTAFRVTAPGLPSNIPLILVDDVLTTGSTIESAAAFLRQAGYTNICALVFAWAMPANLRV